MNGIHNMSRETYNAVDAVNFSTLKAARDSLKHYRHACDEPREQTQAMLVGHGSHVATLEPHRFDEEFAVFTGPTRRGKEWEAFEEKNARRTILKSDEADKCLAIAAAVRANHLAAALLARCTAFEASIVWTDGVTGLRCKGRADGIGPGVLVDLKTARTIDARLFCQQQYTLGSHLQSQFYREGIAACTGVAPQAFLIAVENTAPYDVGVFEVGHDALFAASEELRELLAKVKQGRESGQWPGRYAEVQELVLPRWAFPDDDDLGLNMPDGD